MVYIIDGSGSGTVTGDFQTIHLGRGEIEIADATFNGLPALWFGREGRGLDAPLTVHNRPAKDGETLLVIEFSDIRALDALEGAIARVRASMVVRAK